MTRRLRRLGTDESLPVLQRIRAGRPDPRPWIHVAATFLATAWAAELDEDEPVGAILVGRGGLALKSALEHVRPTTPMGLLLLERTGDTVSVAYASVPRGPFGRLLVVDTVVATGRTAGLAVRWAQSAHPRAAIELATVTGVRESLERLAEEVPVLCVWDTEAFVPGAEELTGWHHDTGDSELGWPSDDVLRENNGRTP